MKQQLCGNRDGSYMRTLYVSQTPHSAVSSDGRGGGGGTQYLWCMLCSLTFLGESIPSKVAYEVTVLSRRCVNTALLFHG